MTILQQFVTVLACCLALIMTGYWMQNNKFEAGAFLMTAGAVSIFFALIITLGTLSSYL